MKKSILSLALGVALYAQGQGARGPVVVSPEVNADRKITFRLLAPNVEAVKVSAGDIPGAGQGVAMTKGENGIWEATLGPVPAGAYRYNFNVGGITVADPRNPLTSESVSSSWSLVNVPGSDMFDTREVPHGAVAAVTYYSTVLKRFRRMHIYTPAGYELGKEKLPVFYLLHGAGDSDHSWSTVGRAGFILDNLIATKQAKPMIMVMPAGHVSAGMRMQGPDPFVDEFSTDILPYVEKNYRVVADRSHRAIAGLSMGGNHTMMIAFPHLNQYAYIGVFSSGLLREFPTARQGAPPTPRTGPSWEEENKTLLDDANAKKGLKLVWFGIGKDDFLLDTSKKTVALLEKHGFHPVFKETEGGHTWLNWRDYLSEFAPKLFQ